MKKNDPTREQLEEAIKNSNLRREVLKKFNITGAVYRRLLRNYNIEYPKWDRYYYRRIALITKICPQCEEEFKVKDTEIGRGQQTCSYSCSNKYFREGRGNYNSPEQYRKRCFNAYGKKCAVCDEQNVVEVHHLDRNRNNNVVENLIPLCPTHHMYMHSKFKEFIQEEVNQFIEEYIRGVTQSA